MASQWTSPYRETFDVVCYFSSSHCLCIAREKRTRAPSDLPKGLCFPSICHFFFCCPPPRLFRNLRIATTNPSPPKLALSVARSLSFLTITSLPTHSPLPSPAPYLRHLVLLRCASSKPPHCGLHKAFSSLHCLGRFPVLSTLSKVLAIDASTY